MGSSLNIARALPVLRLLTPSVSFKLIQAAQSRNDFTVLEIEITDITLSPHGNVDQTILPLGDKVMIKNAGDLH